MKATFNFFFLYSYKYRVTENINNRHLENKTINTTQNKR